MLYPIRTWVKRLNLHPNAGTAYYNEAVGLGALSLLKTIRYTCSRY
jgi:hypothetical protein